MSALWRRQPPRTIAWLVLTLVSLSACQPEYPRLVGLTRKSSGEIVVVARSCTQAEIGLVRTIQLVPRRVGGDERKDAEEAIWRLFTSNPVAGGEYVVGAESAGLTTEKELVGSVPSSGYVMWVWYAGAPGSDNVQFDPDKVEEGRVYIDGKQVPISRFSTPTDCNPR